jgi:hypothetical protein
MGSEFNQAFQLHNMIGGPAATAVVQVTYKGEDGILQCYGTSAVSVLNAEDADTYAPGCLYVRVNGASSIVYINEAAAGSVSSFQALTGTAAEVAGLQEAYQATLAADAGPSPLIWDDALLFEIMLDPSKGFYYFNDFLDLIDVTTGDGWTIATTNSGAIAPVATEDGGVMLFDSAGNGAPDDGVQAQLSNCLFKPVAGRTIRFEARVKMNDTSANISQFFIGLCGIVDPVINTGVIDDTVDKAGFFSHAGTTADRLSVITARTSAEDIDTDKATVADGAYTNLGFVIDGLTSVKWYQDGVLVHTSSVTGNVPNAVMALSFVAQTEGASKDAELSVDWVRILQEGARS